MHFISTGDRFPYSYFVGIMSAAAVGDVKLWFTQKPNSEYFDKAIKCVPSCKIESRYFRTFAGRDPHWNRVSLFDYWAWKIVARHGGSIMGLDSITIRPFQELLGSKDMLVGRDAEPEHWPDAFCMHAATVHPDSELAWKIHERSELALRGEEVCGRHSTFDHGMLRFGGAGIIPFLNVALENIDRISIADFGVLGGYRHDGTPFYLWEKDGELINEDCRTVPFYSTWQKGKANITPHGVRGTLLGKLIAQMGIN